MTAENHQFKTELKKRKTEEVLQKLHSWDKSSGSLRNNTIAKLCRKNSLSRFDDKYLQVLNESGNFFEFYLSC